MVGIDSKEEKWIDKGEWIDRKAETWVEKGELDSQESRKVDRKS